MSLSVELPLASCGARSRLAAVSLSVLAACLAAPSGAAAQAAQAGSTTLGEIVVTANKRSEKLSDTPAAITAATSEQLQKAGVVEPRDLQGLAPGLTVGGSRGSGTFVLRGLNTGTDNNPVVGTQIDGAPICPVATGAGASFLQPQIDPEVISQVEILRGPQGTLYGGSTLGGIVNYVTAKPSLTTPGGSLYGEVSETQRGGANGVARGSYNAPIIQDQLALQASGYYDRFSGFIDAPALGEKDVNDHKSYGGRVALLWAPISDLQVQLAETISRQRTVGDQVTRDSTGAPLAGELGTTAQVLPRYDSNFYLTSLNVDYDAHWAKLSYVGTYQQGDTTFATDLTSYSLGSLAKTVLPLFGGAAVAADAGVGELQPLSFRKTTQEVRLTSPDTGRVRWITGLFYGHESSGAPQNIGAFDDNQSLTTSLLYFDLKTHLTEVAGFGDVTFQVTPKLDITAGVRVGHIKQDYQQLFSGADAGAYNALLTAVGAAPTPTDSGVQHSSDTYATYMANVRYQLSAHNMIYARFSTGFRPGGPNAIAPGLPSTFDADTTHDYEAGWKVNFWDDRAYLDLSAYNIEWNKIQVTTVSNTGVGGLTNGGHAVSRGLEATLSARPVEGLNLTATAAYNDAHFTEDAITTAGVVALKGDRLPNAPRWMGSVSADYTWPLWDGLDGFVGGQLRVVDERYWIPQSSGMLPQYLMPSYVTADLRAGVQRGPIEVQVFVRNVGDKRAELANVNFGPNFVTIARPRTFGASISTKF
jgi:iron complex outermembrane receptor protein